MNIVYKNYLTFKVLGEEVNLMTEELEYGYSTIAEIKDQYHYMGNETPTIATAIYAWQDVKGRELTNDELRQVLIDNDVISQAI